MYTKEFKIWEYKKKIKNLFIVNFLWYNILHANLHEFIRLKHKHKLHLGGKEWKKKVSCVGFNLSLEKFDNRLLVLFKLKNC